MGRQRGFLLLLSLLLPLLHIGDSDLAADRATLLAFRDAVAGRTALWKVDEADPCGWAGVSCNGTRVTALRLPGFDLSGEFPARTIENLTSLSVLSLRFNALSGLLPQDLSRCTHLLRLNLRGNRFSGEIPEKLFDLHGLVHLDLSQNNLSGPISPRFNDFTRMKSLFLENNGLEGPLPELHLDKLKGFNVSFNNLNGSVPSSLASLARTSFLGNSLCGGPLKSCAGNESAPARVPAHALPYGTVDIGNGIHKNGNKKLSGAAVAGIVIGSVVGFLLISLIAFIVYRKNSNPRTRTLDIPPVKRESAIPGVKHVGETDDGGGLGLNNGYSGVANAMAAGGNEGIGTEGANKKLVLVRRAAEVFDLEDLLRASAEVLGKGTFGTAYKATLEMGMELAVKRLKEVVTSEREFMEKVEVVGSLDHDNLVPLRAYYYSRDEKLLVYDYMPMGSLSALLHGYRGAGRSPLNLKMRSSIALGAAHGITYLHAQGPDFSHGNIKSSNVLLTKSYCACVSDFGLANLVGPPSNPTRVAAYRAPEVTDPRRSSQKADVYSFGILLLELLTGKPPTNALLNEEGVDLPRWVQSVVQEQWTSEVFDAELQGDRNFEAMLKLLQLAIDCSDLHPDKRPTMATVAKQIEELRLRDDGKGKDDDLVDLDDGSSQ